MGLAEADQAFHTLYLFPQFGILKFDGGEATLLQGHPLQEFGC
jgi:hypothetical protein